MPHPPPFYKLYQFFGKVKDGCVEVDSNQPLEETFLYDPPKPPKPVEGTYLMFGKVYGTEDRLPTLEEEGRTQLYQKDNTDHIYELKKLNRSLVTKFLELVDFLTNNPSEFRSKVEDLELLFVNMHHLINSYRPNQARQILITMMEEQIKRRQETMTTIDNSITQLKEVYDSVIKVLEEGGNLPPALLEQIANDVKSENVAEMDTELGVKPKDDQVLQKMKNILDLIKPF